MEQRSLSKALSTLRIEQDFDFDFFAADGFRVQDIIDKTSLPAINASKLDRGAAVSEASPSWDQISNLLTSFQR